MTGSQKTLRVLSIIIIVLSIITLALGLMTCMGTGLLAGASANATGADQETLVLGASIALVATVLVVVEGVVDLVVGLLGLRGAKDPSKIMPFFVIAVIGLVLAVIGIISTLLSGSLDPSVIIGEVLQLALMIWVVYLANNIRQMR